MACWDRPQCGYRCDLCLTYRPNLETDPSNQQKLSDGWYKYFGFRLLPEKILCHGCISENPRLIDQGCPVRPCVIKKGFKNCSQCDQYICEKLTEWLVVDAEVRQRVNADIPEDDYLYFVQPYENKKRLDELHVSRKLKNRQGGLFPLDFMRGEPYINLKACG